MRGAGMGPLSETSASSLNEQAAPRMGWVAILPGGYWPWWYNGHEFQAVIFPTRDAARRFLQRHDIVHAKITRISFRWRAR